jgi:hypothetical protein
MKHGGRWRLEAAPYKWETAIAKLAAICVQIASHELDAVSQQPDARQPPQPPVRGPQAVGGENDGRLLELSM